MYTEKQKQAIYEWRRKNKERYAELQSQYAKKYYKENSNEIKKNTKKYRENNKEILKEKRREKNIARKKANENKANENKEVK